MTLHEAFDHQLKNTRELCETDLGDDDPIHPVVWNGVIFRPDGNFYSSGREMKIGDQLIVGYVVETETMPKPILIEAGELDEYEKTHQVIRVVDNIPVLSRKSVHATNTAT